jgi:hypothetical protein
MPGLGDAGLLLGLRFVEESSLGRLGGGRRGVTVSRS